MSTWIEIVEAVRTRAWSETVPKTSFMCLMLLTLPLAFEQAPVRSPGIPTSARQAIAAANAEWLPAMQRQDAAAIAAVYADDGVFVAVSGEAVRGRAAVEQFMRDRFASSGRVVGGNIVQDGLTRAGALIYEWGHADLQLSRNGQTPTASSGRYLTVWAADSQGRWRIIRNLSLP